MEEDVAEAGGAHLAEFFGGGPERAVVRAGGEGDEGEAGGERGGGGQCEGVGGGGLGVGEGWGPGGGWVGGARGN